jgi:hypothetical protein
MRQEKLPSKHCGDAPSLYLGELVSNPGDGTMCVIPKSGHAFIV